MVLAPFRARSRSRSDRSANQEAHRFPARSGLLAYRFAHTSQVKVSRKLAAARERARAQRLGREQSIESGLVQGTATVLDTVFVGTGRVPQAVSSWLNFSTHLFGFSGPGR